MALPSIGIVPPIITFTKNYRARDLMAVRVVFQPGRLAEIFNLSLKEARDKPDVISSKLESELQPIYRQLSETPNISRQVEIVEGFLLKKLRFHSLKPALLSHLHKLCLEGGYNRSVRAIAREVGYSERHLNRLVAEKAGYSISEFMKIHRLNRILERFHEAEGGSLSRLAQEMGYYDQSHFIREFRRFTQMSPSDYLKSIGHRVLTVDNSGDFEYSGLLFTKKKALDDFSIDYTH